MSRAFEVEAFQFRPASFQEPSAISASASLGMRAGKSAASAGVRNTAATASFGLRAGLITRQFSIHPKLFVNANRLNFQPVVHHRGGGARKSRPVRPITPERRPPTFRQFLDNWRPPPFRLPAPDLVRKSVRDRRAAPQRRPLDHDVSKIERQIADAIDHRDALALLERLLHFDEAARQAQDERDAAKLMSGLD